MRIFSYRNRRRLRNTGIALIALLVLLIAFLLLRFVFLERYLVYTQRGAYFSFEPPAEVPAEKPQAQAPVPVEIVYVTPEEAAEPTLSQISGVYLSCSDLSDMDAVTAELDKVLAEPGRHAVLIELKNASGRFYYTSALGMTANIDLTAVDGLLRSLRENPDVYLMASIPAFSDSAFALENQSEGLPIQGGALWMDYDANYWLDPASSLVQTHLVAQLQELSELGVQEVVFTKFCFPDSENIVYESEQTKAELVNEAADFVAKAMDGTELRVSFETSDPDFQLPASAARVVLDGIDGASAAMQAAQYTDDALRVLFYTSSRDTRFSAYSVLRPLLERGEEE